jgi:basic membrane protein A
VGEAGVRAWAAVAVLGGLAFALTFLPARKKSDALPNAAAIANRAKNTTEGSLSHTAPLRIGLVFDVGGRGDKSFNDAAYVGLERAEQELGAEVSYLEPTGSEDREAALRLFAANGLDLVVGVGFIFSSDVDAVAHAYPNVHFACVDYASFGKPVPPNVAALDFREEEGSFLVGAVAGLMSKTKHVGFVGGMTIPLIRKFEAGYIAGVKVTCDACIVHSAYVGPTPDAFKDPAKGKTLAISEIAAGADVIFHAAGSTGHGVFEGARDAHVLAIGVDSDQYDDMPGTVLTSMVKGVDVSVFDTIKDVQNGHFQAGTHAFGLAENGVDYVHEGPHGALIPDSIKAKVEELRARVISGEIKVPSE